MNTIRAALSEDSQFWAYMVEFILHFRLEEEHPQELIYFRKVCESAIEAATYASAGIGKHVRNGNPAEVENGSEAWWWQVALWIRGEDYVQNYCRLDRSLKYEGCLVIVVPLRRGTEDERYYRRHEVPGSDAASHEYRLRDILWISLESVARCGSPWVFNPLR